MSGPWLELAYLAAAVFFIVGLRQLASPRTAPRGNTTAAAGMLIAVVATLAAGGIVEFRGIALGILLGSVIGVVLALFIQMTAMPQLVALFNGLGGGASAMVAAGALLEPQPGDLGIVTVTAVAMGVLIGMVTLTGSLVAFAKLQELVPGGAIRSYGLTAVSLLAALLTLALGGALLGAPASGMILAGLAAASGLLGVLSVVGIGGADMPVVIALLNALSGLAASATGFALGNDVLIVSGSLVGASGVILTQIMCKGMNRSLGNVLFGGFGAAAPAGSASQGPAVSVRGYSVEEAAMVLIDAQSVIVVPGYGLAVAQAQHTVRELADQLAKRDVEVLYAIHPVAGRMPGHMNVLLAEANVPYESLKDLEEINPLFPQTDVVLVVGANDVINPLARSDQSSPIFGMPILDVDKSRICIVLKRSMRPGFAGIANPLYASEKTMMVFGDAKETLVEMVTQVKQG